MLNFRISLSIVFCFMASTASVFAGNVDVYFINASQQASIDATATVVSDDTGIVSNTVKNVKYGVYLINSFDVDVEDKLDFELRIKQSVLSYKLAGNFKADLNSDQIALLTFGALNEADRKIQNRLISNSTGGVSQASVKLLQRSLKSGLSLTELEHSITERLTIFDAVRALSEVDATNLDTFFDALLTYDNDMSTLNRVYIAQLLAESGYAVAANNIVRRLNVDRVLASSLLLKDRSQSGDLFVVSLVKALVVSGYYSKAANHIANYEAVILEAAKSDEVLLGAVSVAAVNSMRTVNNASMSADGQFSSQADTNYLVESYYGSVLGTARNGFLTTNIASFDSLDNFLPLANVVFQSIDIPRAIQEITFAKLLSLMADQPYSNVINGYASRGFLYEALDAYSLLVIEQGGFQGIKDIAEQYPELVIGVDNLALVGAVALIDDGDKILALPRLTYIAQASESSLTSALAYDYLTILRGYQKGTLESAAEFADASLVHYANHKKNLLELSSRLSSVRSSGSVNSDIVYSDKTADTKDIDAVALRESYKLSSDQRLTRIGNIPVIKDANGNLVYRIECSAVSESQAGSASVSFNNCYYAGQTLTAIVESVDDVVSKLDQQMLKAKFRGLSAREAVLTSKLSNATNYLKSDISIELSGIANEFNSLAEVILASDSLNDSDKELADSAYRKSSWITVVTADAVIKSAEAFNSRAIVQDLAAAKRSAMKADWSGCVAGSKEFLLAKAGYMATSLNEGVVSFSSMGAESQQAMYNKTSDDLLKNFSPSSGDISVGCSVAEPVSESTNVLLSLDHSRASDYEKGEWALLNMFVGAE